MTIKLPKKGERAEWIRPFDVDGDTSRYNTPDVKPVTNSVQAPASNLTIANINPREYIQVGINGLNGTPVAISAYELQGSNNKNYEDAHRFALQQGLYIPTPTIFMTHFCGFFVVSSSVFQTLWIYFFVNIFGRDSEFKTLVLQLTQVLLLGTKSNETRQATIHQEILGSSLIIFCRYPNAVLQESSIYTKINIGSLLPF